MIEELALKWISFNYAYTKYFNSRPVDCIIGKEYGTIEFYFTEEEDILWHEEYQRQRYKEYCNQNHDPSIETAIEMFNKRIFYSIFISDFFINTSMVTKMLEGKNLKKIK